MQTGWAEGSTTDRFSTRVPAGPGISPFACRNLMGPMTLENFEEAQVAESCPRGELLLSMLAGIGDVAQANSMGQGQPSGVPSTPSGLGQSVVQSVPSTASKLVQSVPSTPSGLVQSVPSTPSGLESPLGQQIQSVASTEPCPMPSTLGSLDTASTQQSVILNRFVYLPDAQDPNYLPPSP